MNGFGINVILCILVASNASNDVIRRSDDDNIRALIATVEKQAATIQGLQSRVQSLETSLTNNQNQMQAKINALERKAQNQSQNIEKLSTKVAFSAHMSKSAVAIGDSSPFVFDAVTNNIGGAYTGHSGIFIAPTPGVYVFQFTMVNNRDDPTVHAAIVKNGQTLAMGTSESDGPYNSFDDGSALVTTRLAKGDQIYIKRAGYGARLDGSWWCNFSGFLISVDL